MHKKWLENHVDLKDTFKTFILIYSKKQNTLVSNMKGPKEVQVNRPICRIWKGFQESS